MAAEKVCCLVPAFNEEKRIAAVVSGALRKVGRVFVVDDGSQDRTADAAKAAGALVIRHEINSGKGMALRTGFQQVLDAGYDAVITLDADGQHNPEEIDRFLEAYAADTADIIVGSRMGSRDAIPTYRYIPNRIGIFCISRAAGCPIEDTQSGFRLYRRQVLEQTRLKTTGFETETEVLIRTGRNGFRIASIPVSAVYHADYTTNFRPVRDFYRISILVLKLVFLDRKD